MSPSPNHDDPRDAHLLAALRHAPDRDVVPPAPLSAAILGHARQAVQVPKARAVGLDALRAVLDRLWQPAPMAAFGTLAMATLIGVMWGGHDVPDATPGLRPTPAAATPPPTRTEKSTAATRTEAAPTRDDASAAVPAAAAKSSVPAAPVARPKPADARARQDAARERQVRRDAADSAGAVATAPMAAAPAPAMPAPAAVAEAPPPREVRGGALGDAVPAPARARSEMAAPSMGAAAQGASPLARVSAEIDAAAAIEPARVRWRVTAQRVVVHDAAQQAWWSTLARATEGRWQAAAPASAAGGGETAPLTLLIDGATRGSLGFEPQAVLWRDADGAVWRAPATPAQRRAWQEAVARW